MNFIPNIDVYKCGDKDDIWQLFVTAKFLVLCLRCAVYIKNYLRSEPKSVMSETEDDLVEVSFIEADVAVENDEFEPAPDDDEEYEEEDEEEDEL